VTRPPVAGSFVCAVCGEEFVCSHVGAAAHPLPACPCCGADETHWLGAAPAGPPPEDLRAA
jgi:hypothetical protein